MAVDSAAFSRSLQGESDALRAFVALLLEEQQALVRGDLERLTSFAAPKSQTLLELTRRGNDRQRLLREHGLTIDSAGMERLLEEPSIGTPQVIAAWHELLNLTRTAQQVNETNGTLINARLRGTQQALNVLLSAAQIPGTYTADGSTVSSRRRQSLGVA
jgi:flagellar biosynthesis protein FlgN